MKRIVVGYNGTDACRTALAHAGALARRTGAVLDVVSVGIPVVPVGGFGWISPYDAGAEMDELVRDRVREASELVDPEIECHTHALFGMPAAEIVELAASTGANRIVVGSVRRSALERIFVGSTTERVVRLAHTPVIVAAAAELPQRLLVAVDESAFGEHALRTALEQAAATGASVRCVHVVPEPDPDLAKADVDQAVLELRERVEAFVAGVHREAEAAGEPPETVVRLGPVCERILEEAQEWEADLIAAGSHGRGFVGRAILGSVSEDLLHRAPLSLLIAPGAAK